MPIFTLPNQIQFFYEDSGAPTLEDYLTFFIVHGHTYHSSVFLPLFAVGKSQSHRVILVNRREYSGSTPYTSEEFEVFEKGSDEARYKQFIADGANLSLLLDGLIQSLSLPKTVSIVGWSLGNIFTLPMLASISTLPEEAQARLATHVKRTIIWDPPCDPLGIPGPGYMPLWDEALPAESRGIEFGKWMTAYFNHSDLSKRKFDLLNQRDHDTSRKRTFEDLPLEELFKIMDVAAGAKADTLITVPQYLKPEKAVVTKAVFDAEVRETWSSMKIWYMVGNKNPWNVIYCWWTLEDEVKAANFPEPAINFTINEGANHFFMWDDPEGAMKKLEFCARS
jgi:pimeloyl-ACP methyl ester carboxylesterase